MIEPYIAAMQQNRANQQRRDMMVQKLAPVAPAAMAASGGSGGAPRPVGDFGALAAPSNALQGVNPEMIRKVAQAFAPNPEGKAGLFGGGQDGFRSGVMGTGIGGQNSQGADVLQSLGMYNPLPQT